MYINIPIKRVDPKNPKSTINLEKDLNNNVHQLKEIKTALFSLTYNQVYNENKHCWVHGLFLVCEHMHSSKEEALTCQEEASMILSIKLNRNIQFSISKFEEIEKDETLSL